MTVEKYAKKEIMKVSTRIEEFKPEKCFIAYLDILGYEKILKKIGTTELVKIIKNILTTLKEEQKYIKETLEGLGALDFKFKIFSDNIIICNKNPIYLWILVAGIQSKLIEQNIFTRGALCYEDLYIDDDLVCGEGIIKAHKLETEQAKYPRVILDEPFLKQLNILLKGYKPFAEVFDFSELKQLEQHLLKDYDNNIFINYLRILTDATGSISFIKLHKDNIAKNLKEYKNNELVFPKYEWCKIYHNKFCQENPEYLEYVIE